MSSEIGHGNADEIADRYRLLILRLVSESHFDNFIRTTMCPYLLPRLDAESTWSKVKRRLGVYDKDQQARSLDFSHEFPRLPINTNRIATDQGSDSVGRLPFEREARVAAVAVELGSRLRIRAESAHSFDSVAADMSAVASEVEHIVEAAHRLLVISRSIAMVPRRSIDMSPSELSERREVINISWASLVSRVASLYRYEEAVGKSIGILKSDSRNLMMQSSGPLTSYDPELSALLSDASMNDSASRSLDDASRTVEGFGPSSLSRIMNEIEGSDSNKDIAPDSDADQDNRY